MNDSTAWIDTIREAFANQFDLLLRYLPQVTGAILLLLGGWILAAMLRSLVIRMARGLEWILPRVLPGGMGMRLSGILQPRLLGAIVFWLVLLAFLATATQVLGLSVFSSWLDAFFNLLPMILLAALLVICSVVLSHLARETVIRTAAAAGLEYHVLLGYGVQLAILITAAVIALDLVGLDITFLVVVLSILLGTVAGAAALAFALGSQGLVSNLLGVRAVQQRFKEGDSIRIGTYEGKVLSMERRLVVIETREGQVSIPGRYFNEQPCVVLMREDMDG